MKDETLVLIVVATMIALFSYINLVATEYKPVESNVSSSTFTPDRVKPNEIPELPELSEQEEAETDSLFKSYVKEAEEESKRKSVETMRDEVHKILDEVIEADSTVTITFNMTVKNPLMYETKEK
jgi:hypothetical protein|tara:strand:+ start:950 stop:1324 length:375 start_codon:yes stop_codon:yes gene_type:complete